MHCSNILVFGLLALKHSAFALPASPGFNDYSLAIRGHDSEGCTSDACKNKIPIEKLTPAQRKAEFKPSFIQRMNMPGAACVFNVAAWTAWSGGAAWSQYNAHKSGASAGPASFYTAGSIAGIPGTLASFENWRKSNPRATEEAWIEAERKRVCDAAKLAQEKADTKAETEKGKASEKAAEEGKGGIKEPTVIPEGGIKKDTPPKPDPKVDTAVTSGNDAKGGSSKQKGTKDAIELAPVKDQYTKTTGKTTGKGPKI